LQLSLGLCEGGCPFLNALLEDFSAGKPGSVKQWDKNAL